MSPDVSVFEPGRFGFKNGILLGVDEAHSPDFKYCFPYDLAFVLVDVLVCLSGSVLVRRRELTSSTEEGEPETVTTVRLPLAPAPAPAPPRPLPLPLPLPLATLFLLEPGNRREYDPLMSPGNVVILRVLRVREAIVFLLRPRPFRDE
jgi:hypothetical protein